MEGKNRWDGKSLAAGAILGVILGGILGFFVFQSFYVGPSSPSAQSETAAGVQSPGVIPGTGYTCGQILPGAFTFIFYNGNYSADPYFNGGANKLVINQTFADEYCTRNVKTGENINSFSCSFNFSEAKRVSSSGVNEPGYAVSYDIAFDNRNCSFEYNVTSGSIMNCLPVSESCGIKSI